MYKICVVNIGSESNKGTAAITLGTLRLLKKLFPESSITCISLYDDHSPYVLLKHTFPEVEMVNNFQPLFTTSFQKALECLRIATGVVPLPSHPAIEAIKESDFVIARSSPIFRSRSKFLNYSAARASMPLLVARKFAIPYGLAPQTFWPVSGLQAQMIIKNLCQEASFVMVRDMYSFNELIKMRLEPILGLDHAFWIEPSDYKYYLLSRETGLEDKEFVVVIPKSTGNIEVDKALYKKMLMAITSTELDENQKILLVQHNLVEDTGAVRTFWTMGTEYVGNRILVLDCAELSPEDLAGIYQHAKLVVSMRLHGVLMSLLVGAPVLGLDTDGRISAVLKTLGLYSCIARTWEDEKCLRERMKQVHCYDFELIRRYIEHRKVLDEINLRELIVKGLERRA
jgi:polysaccharide pyruvyl transferase WcaK-like protein